SDSAAMYTVGMWNSSVQQARREGVRRAKELSALGTWDIPPLASADHHEIENAVRQTVIQDLPLAAEAITNARNLVEKLKPKVLVVGNDLTLEGRAGSRVAAQAGIATAMFMHGSIAGDPLQTQHCVARIFVNGPVHREELMRQGIDGQRI